MMQTFKIEQIDGASYAGRAREGHTRIVREDQVEATRQEMRESFRTNPEYSSDSVKVTEA
jgi:hypothetical protein